MGIEGGQGAALKSGAITVVPVEGKALWRAFHDLPAHIYRDDPHWILPLRVERQAHFDPGQNAFFKHAKGRFWLALRDGRPVGRITAQIDALHLKQHNDDSGHFGFIEGEDDPAVFAALLREAEDWLRAEGMKRVLGPVSFQMWDEPGLLVEGFDKPPNIFMGHAWPYYQNRIVEQGYEQAQDLLAYEYPMDRPFNAQLERLIAKAGKKNAFNFRPARLDGKHIADEIALIRDILNDAWAENWGFVPMTLEEIEDLSAWFKYLLPPDAFVFAEYEGETIGFGMMLPNLNAMIRDLNGKLFPFGIFKLLWRLKVVGARSGRMALMGVRRRLWSSPVGAIAALMIVKTARYSKFASVGETAELSWVLDSNERIKHVLAQFGATVTKRYRIYQKAL